MTGAAPRGVPSTTTRAPEGSLRICSCPVSATGFGTSTNCETVAPAVIVSGMVRGSPSVSSVRTCEPAATSSRTGVWPLRLPSSTTATPGGFVSTTSVPGAAASAEGENNERPAKPMPAASITNTAAATERRRHHGVLCVMSSRSCSSSWMANLSWPLSPLCEATGFGAPSNSAFDARTAAAACGVGQADTSRD